MAKEIGRAPRKAKGPKSARSVWPTILFTLLVLLCIGAGSVLGVVVGTLRNTPKLEDLAYSPSVATNVYDAHGDLVTKLHAGENRTPVPISEIPQALQDAVVAVEDDRFYSHHGVNPLGIMRAFVVNLRAGRSAQGGSTITQQLIKNTLLTPDKLLTRKIKEAILAVQLERTYTKEEILELYLNQIYFGHGAYGVEAAAQTYFGKHARELTLAQCALVAGVTRGPRYYSPYLDPEAAKRRRGIVLGRMRILNYITASQYDKALKEGISDHLVGLKSSDSVAPYFIDYIREELIDRFGVDQVFKGGLSVHTTLDLRLQRAAEAAVYANLPNGYVDAKGLNQPQCALICIDPQTGYIQAMVGGRGDDKYNRATQALRQPGSAFKPLVYVTALENGYTPDTTVKDEAVSYPTEFGKTWSPMNYDRRYRGVITLRQALEQSINTIAVKVADQVGVPRILDMAGRLGITTLVESGPRNDRNLSLALGGLTRGVSPLQLAVAYAAFDNKGYRVKPVAISEVQDKFGNVVDRVHPDKTPVLDEATSFLITDMMRGVIERGTGRAARIGRPAAGKTGTTSDNTNAWFAGYTPELVTVVWIGNDEQAKPIRERGVSIGSARAARIWGAFMVKALHGRPVTNFDVPESVQPDLSTTTGAGPAPPSAPTDEAVPSPAASQAEEVEELYICASSEQLATENCPQDLLEARLYDVVSGQEVGTDGNVIPGTERPNGACEVHPGPLLGTL